MASPGGVDAELTVGIDADADAAARELEKELGAAFARALSSKNFQNALRQFGVAFSKTFQTNVGKSSKATFDAMTKAGIASAKRVAAAFREVGTAAGAAIKSPGRSPSLTTLETQIKAVVDNFENLQNASKQTLKVIEETFRAERAAVRSRDQAYRDSVLTSTQAQRQLIVASQERQNAARNAALVESASIRATSREAIQRSRAMVRVFELTWKSAERAVRAFARGASQILRGLVRAVSSIFRGVERAVSATFRASQRSVQAFARSASALFRGFGRGITSALSGVSRAIAAAMRRDENTVRASLRRREQETSRSARRQAGLLGGIGAGGLLGGAAAGGGIFSLLTSGFERAGLQERLQLQFTALLGDADAAQAKLQELSDYAQATAFDFDEVALSVAQLTSAFGDVGRAQEMTQLLADLTALTGGTTAQLSAARLAFSQIAATGRLEAQELNQLFESLPGVPIAQILADRFFGGDVAAFQQARKNGELGGKITADAFFDALREGAQERFPELDGFAIQAAGTLTGRLSNLREQFAIFGSTLIGIVEGPIKSFMSGLNEALDLAGQFITGELFTGGGGGRRPNPFENITDPTRRISVEELLASLTPEQAERQRAAFEAEGFEGAFVSAADARAIFEGWQTDDRPDNVFGLSDDTLENLQELRAILGDVVKAVGGVLALAAAFKILTFAFAAFTSPLGLLVLGTAALATLFSLMRRNSPAFQTAIDGLTDAFGGLIEAFGHIGRAIGGVVGRWMEGEGPAWFRRLGDAAAGLADGFTGAVNWFSELINGIAALIETDRADRIPEFIRNKLDETFLGPVIDFFQNHVFTVIGTIAGYISGFFSEIWEAWTGGGGTDDRTAAILSGSGTTGTSGDDSWLATTFLDPVVQFFRSLPGRVADIAVDIASFWSGIWDAMTGGPSEAELTGSVITTAGGAGTAGGEFGPLQPLWNSLTNFKNNIRDLGLGAAFGEIWDGITESAGNIWDGGDGQGGIKGALDAMWESVKAWFADLDWGSAISGAAVAGAIGIALAGLPGLVVGIIAGFIAGDFGLLDWLTGPIIDGIERAWTEIEEALDGLWEDITGWFSDTFTAEALEGAAKTALSGINEAGRAIGEFISDPLFVGIVAGVVGGIITAIAAIILSFTAGLVEGVINNADNWGRIIADGFTTAMDVLITEGPGIVVSALTAIFTDPGLVLGLALGGLIIGSGAGKAVAGGLVNFFRNRTESAKLRKAVSDGIKNAGIGTAVTTGLNQAPTPPAPVTFFSKIRTSINNGITRAKETFAGIGRNLGAAILGGLAAFEFGQIGGRSGSAGGLLISLLAGAGTGAAVGSAIPGVGTAVGAGIGLALAGVGAAIGATGAAAERAASELNEYVAALEELGGASGTLEAATDTVLTNLRDETSSTQDFLVDAGFSARDFADAVIEGNFDIEDSFLNLLNNAFFKAVSSGEFGNQAGDALTGLLDTLTELDSQGQLTALTLQDALVANPEAAAALEQLGYDGNVLLEVFDVLGDESNEIDGALTQIGRNTGLADAAETIDSVAEAAERINEELGAGATADQIADILSQADLTSEESLQAVADVAGAVEAALHDARQALVDFITGGDQPATEQEILSRFTLDAAGTQREAERLTEETNQAIIDASRNLNLVEFGDNLNQAIAAAVEAGVITDPTSFETFKQSLIDQVNATVTDPALKADMLAAIEGLQVPTADLFQNLQVAQMTQAKVDEIAGIIESGIEQALGQVSLSELTASVLTTTGGVGTAGGLSIDLGAEGLGQTYSTQVALGISNNADEVKTAVSTDLVGAGDDGITASSGTIQGTGRTYTEELANGILAAAAAAAGAARLVAAIAVASTAGMSDGMYNAGSNAGNALARGLVSQVRAAATAAAAVATAVVTSARNALQIASPSKVFVNIGRDVGRGFIQGIKDAEGDMAQAISSALENAVAKGTRQAGLAIARAQAAGQIFSLLAPSVLPGGATTASIRTDLLELQQAISGTRAGFGAGAADALGGLGSADLAGAVATLRNSGSAFQQMILEVNETFREANQQRSALATYDRNLKSINAAYKSGALGQQRYWQEIAELKQQVKVGTLTTESYAEQVKILNNELKLGILNQEAYNDALNKLGDRPDALTFTQQQILRTGATTLDPRTAQGLSNREQFVGFLESIREFGQEALNSGRALPVVIRQMQGFRDALIRQATQAGFNRQQILALVESTGLSNQALATLRQTLTSLNATTQAGRQNVVNMLDQLVSIREFGQRMLEAGVPITNVISQLRQLRNSFVNQAVAFGFNRNQVNNLVNQVGLSDAALKRFVAELQAFEKAAKGANAVAAQATAEAEKRRKAEEAAERAEEEKRLREEREKALEESKSTVQRPTIERLVIEAPFGDPEAIALATWNRVSYGLLTGVT